MPRSRLPLLLIAVKFAAWLETGSVALLSSVIDSLLDAAASIINLIAVRHAMTPGRSRASLWPRQGGTAGGSRAVGLYHRQRLAAAGRGGAPIDRPASGPQPAARHRGHGLLDRRDRGARALSAACRATYRLDRDQRRRIALPQRRGSEPQRHRRPGPWRAVRTAASSTRCSAQRSASGSSGRRPGWRGFRWCS